MFDGKILQQLRIKAGFKQTELAAKLRCPRSAISDYERGAKSPRVARQKRIARLLGCSVEDLQHDEKLDWRALTVERMVAIAGTMNDADLAEAISRLDRLAKSRDE